MRKHNQEIKSKDIINTILSNSKICRIAMIDNGRPYLLPFNYGYKDNCIYIHSAPEGKKIEILKRNNEVCFEIEDHTEIIKNSKPCKCATKYRSVVGYGNVEIITDNEQKKNGLDIIMTHNGIPTENNVYEKSQVELLVILKLNITQISGKQSSNWLDEQIK